MATRGPKISTVVGDGQRPAKLGAVRLLANGLTPELEAYARSRALGMSVAEARGASNVNLAVSTLTKYEDVRSPKCNPILVARINELAGIAAENAILKSGLDREWVISRLMAVAERCMEAVPVTDSKGQPIDGQWTFDARGANTALRSLGDTLGMFRPLPKNPDDDYSQLSDAELERLAIELARNTGLTLDADVREVDE